MRGSLGELRAAAPTIGDLTGQDARERTPHAVLVIAGRLEPDVRDRFIAAMDAARSDIDVEALIEALKAGDIELALSIAVEGLKAAGRFDDVVDSLRQAFETMGTQTMSGVAAVTGVDLSFDMANEAAAAWMREYGARLVTNVTDATRAAIAEYLATGIEEGRSYSESAREIARMIGSLDINRVRSLEKYRKNLMSQGVAGGELDKKLESYAGKLLRSRAQTIASYETVRATNAGQEIAWRVAQERGALSSKAKREWITTPDDRLCPDCLSMDGVEVGLNEPFDTPVGAVMVVNDIHVRCRCSEGLTQW